MESIKYFVMHLICLTQNFNTKTKFHSQTSYVHDNRKCRKVRNALFEAGAGNSNYEDCSFSSKGIGTYMGNENSDPQLERV
jgi:hypothetical protein